MVDIKREKLEEFMRANNLNYSDLARLLGYSKSTLSKIVNGKLGASSRFIARFKVATGISIEDFFDFSDPEFQKPKGVKR